MDSAAMNVAQADRKEFMELFEKRAETYRYRLTPAGYGSQRYGNCEVCGKHCDSVYIQTEERAYSIEGVRGGWTQHKCSSYFGHQDCLISKRR